MTARTWRIVGAAVALAALVAMPLTLNDLYYQNLIIFTMVLAIMASTWNIAGGFAGYVSLGHSVFLGLGAYTTTVLVVTLGWPWWIAFLFAGVTSAGLSAVFALITRRTRGTAYVIVTFAALELFKVLAMNLTELTRGNHGISLPILSLGRDYQQWPYYYGLLGILVATVALVLWIRRSKLGAGLLGIREDEDKAASIGVSTPQYKLAALVLAGVPVGFAGAIYAGYLGFIDPRGMFSIAVSMQIVLAVVLGGRGTVFGPLLGAAIVEPLSQVTNTFVTGPEGGSWRLIIFGGILILVMLVLPQGIVPAIAGRLERRRARGTIAATGERLSAPQDAEGVRAAVERVRAVTSVAERARPEPDSHASGPLLSVRAISKRYGGLLALDECSFEVPAGSITALIGPNGSGKTTAFNMIDGSGRIDSGEIWFDGQRIDRLPRWERAHLGIGRTFQMTRLFPKLTVRENLVAPLRDFSWRSLAAPAMTGAESQRAEAVLEMLGLERYLDVRAGGLSYGQQKLVEFGQTLVLDPRLVLLDEPTGGINEAIIDQMTRIVLELQRTGTTFLIVEHNMPFVLANCEPVNVLAAGRRIAVGDAEEVRSNPLVLEAYLGTAPEEATR